MWFWFGFIFAFVRDSFWNSFFKIWFYNQEMKANWKPKLWWVCRFVSLMSLACICWKLAVSMSHRNTLVWIWMFQRQFDNWHQSCWKRQRAAVRAVRWQLVGDWTSKSACKSEHWGLSSDSWAVSEVPGWALVMCSVVIVLGVVTCFGLFCNVFNSCNFLTRISKYTVI